MEIGDGSTIETHSATAHALAGEERDRLYARQAEFALAFAEYQAKTTRTIPVVALYRDDPARARALGDELVRIHDDLRRELATLVSEVEDLVGGRTATPGRPAPSLTAQLRQRCLSVCGNLDHHHTNEMDRGFPLLEQRFPGVAPVLEQFRREHETLADIRRQVERTLAELGAGDDLEVLAELRRLSGEMEAHFGREEGRLVPALNAL